MAPQPATIENIARVVAVKGHTAWLEPDVTTSCGHCASSASCGMSGAGGEGGQGAGGIGSIASRVEARRFVMEQPPAGDGLRVGERIVVGIAPRSLLKGAVLAYLLPLVTALLAAAWCQDAYAEDGLTLLAMAGGLAGGLFVARGLARLMNARGDLQPRFLRRARPGETCNSDGTSL